MKKYILMYVICAFWGSTLAWGAPASKPAPASDHGGFSLKQTAESVMVNHRTIKSMQESREAASYDVDRAKAGYGPRVDVSSKSGGNALNTSTYRRLNEEGRFYGAYEAGVTVTQPVWDGLATRSRVRATQATLDSMNERVFDNATTLGLDGIIAHIDLLRNRQLVALAEANVRRHEEILASSRDRQSMGADTAADVSQTEARLSRARSTLASTQAALQQAEDTYRRLTGQPVPLLQAAAHPPLLFTSEKAVLERAMKHNPKIKATAADVRAAEGNKELAESAFHPVINVEGGAYTTDRGGDNEDYTSTLEVMGTVKWNVFNSGADAAAVRAAKARIRQSRQIMANQWDDIKLEVRKTWADYQSAKAQQTFYAQAVTFNTNTRDAYMEQFLMGQRSLLDVLDAENELFNSSTQAETMHGNVLIAEYRLHALSGTMLADMHVNTAALGKAPVPEQKPLMDFR